MKLESQLQVSTASGVAPFTVNRNTLVSNLNAQYLNGQLGGYYAAASSLASYLPLAGGTLTGTLYLTDATNGISKAGGRFTIRSESTDDVANFASYGLYLPKSGQTAGLYVESPIEARGGIRIGTSAASGTITVGADTAATANRLVQRDGSGGVAAVSFTGSGSGLTGTATSLTAGAVPWSGITSKPTTLYGFGITDAASINGASNQNFSANAIYPYEWIRFMSASGIYWQSGSYAGWHIHPQALWGMSFRSASTDCGLQLRRSNDVILGSVYSDGTSIGFLDASSAWGASFTLAGAMNRGSVPGSLVTGNISGSAGSVAWSGITSKPTTVSGFGITDTIPSLPYIVEADLNTATATGFRLVSKTGYSSALLTINVAGSTGPFQLDANYNGVLRWRNQTDSGAANWTAWKTLIHDGNYTSYPDATKLPLAGGTLTGGLSGTTGYFSSDVTWIGYNSGNPRSARLGYSGGNYGSVSYGINYTATTASHTYAFNDAVTRIDLADGIQVYSAAAAVAGTAVSWTTLLEATRGNGNLRWKGNTVLDSNNYNSFALPLGGGTMTGSIILPAAGSIGLNGGTTYGIGVAGRSSSAVFDTVDSTGSDPLELNYYQGGPVKIGSGTNGSKSLYAVGIYDNGNAVLTSASTSAPSLSIGGSSASCTGNAATATRASTIAYSVSIDKSSSDLNNETSTGFFRGASMTNAPDTGWWWVMGQSHDNTGSAAGWNHQLAIAYGAGNTYGVGTMMYRSRTGGTTYSSWGTVLTSANYSSYALPLAGGTLTGALNGTTASFSTKVLSSRFHDSGDAFLFRSGSGTGTTRHLNLADATGDPSGITAGTGITWGERSDNNPYYLIYPRYYANGSGTYSRLAIAWHTGIEIGAAPQFGGTRFFNNSPFLGSEIFSVGNGDSNVRVVNTLYIGGNTALHAGNYTSYPDATKLPLTGGTLTGALNGTTAAFSGAITQGGNQVLHAGNYTSYTLPRGGSWYGANLPGTRWGGMTSAGGEIVFGQDLPAAGQMGILIDGCYIAAENNGFWSLASSNDWTTRRGMYFDGTYLRFDYNSATAYFSNASIGGNQVLHAGNYTSYPDATKLPLAGGTLTGALTTNVGGTSIFIGNQNVTTSNGLRINFHTDADLNYYIGKKAGAWTQPLDINFYTGIRLYASSSYDYGISFWNSNNTTKMMSVGEGDSNVRVTNTLYIGGNTALHAGNFATYALPLNPDGDGVCVAYSDENPTFNGVGVGGGWYFGADGSTTGGGLTAKILNAFGGGVNSTNGYYVGNNNFLANSSTTTTTLCIDGSNNHFANELTISGTGIGAYNHLKYGGLRTSGDWQTFTNTAGQINIIEVHNITGGGYTNNPTGVYGYGAVMSWRTSSHSFQLYAAHTGDLAYKTQWGNDNYSGWRRILDSTSYPYAAAMNQNVGTSNSPTFASLLITSEIVIQKDNPRNLAIQGSGGTDCGLLGRGSSGQFAFQLYGNNNSEYGFLNSAWGGWDLRKVPSGSLFLNGNVTYYLNPASATNLYSLTVANTISGSITGNAATATSLTNFTNQSGTRFSTDFNSIVTTGFFNAEATPANAPSGFTYAQLISAKGIDTGLQIAGGYTNDNLWFRGWGPSLTFTGWRKLLHDGNYGGYSTFTGTVTATNFSGPGTSLTGTASSLVAGSANAIADGVVSTSAKIAASVVTYAKIQNVTAYTVLGNSSASGAQAPVEISMATLAGMVSSQYTTNIGNTFPDRVFMSTDANIKYAPIDTAKAHLGLTSKYGNSRPSITGNTSYWTGAMGWGATDWNTVFDWGSGFTDSWSSPANNPGDTSHHLGIQSVHYTNGSTRYGWQMVNGVATGRWWLRDVWGGGFSSWKEVIHSGNIASQTVATAGSCTGNAASASSLAANTNTTFKVIRFTGEGYDSGNGAYPTNYGIYQEGGGWTYPYPDLCIGFHTGIKIGAQTGYGGIRFYNTETWGTEIFSVGNGDNNVRVVNTIYAAAFSGPLTGNVTGNVTGSAGSVAWTNVSGRPTAVSSFSNDSGYITSGGSISGSSGSCSGNAASVTDGVYLSTNQSIGGVKTFSSAPVATNIAKAWVYYNMNNNTIYASYNVSSVTDNGTGVCTVNFSSAMVDANYVVAGTATYGYDDQDIHAMILAVPRRSTAQQAGSCRLATEYIHAAGVYDSIAVRAVFYR